MKSWISLSIAAISLTGCGAHTAASLATAPVNAQAPAAAVTAQQPTVAVTSTAKVQPTVTVQQGGTPVPVTAPDDPNAMDDTSIPDPPSLVSVASTTASAAPVDGPVNGPAGLDRTDAEGRAYSAASTSSYSSPVYLTPRDYPVLLAGSPLATLPHYTPRVADTSSLPTDAFVALADQGRLRQRKPHFMSWLLGYGYPKIDAATAKSLLASGQAIYLAPDGSRLHFARTYVAEATADPINAMLPELRQAALSAATQAAREADIKDRANLLPAFNNSFDVLKLVLLEPAVNGYTYGGQPVHRCLITAMNLYEYSSVRTTIATYWEDHPTTTSAELRMQTYHVLADKFHSMSSEAGSLAAMPTAYTDAQAIPGLRDPRSITDNDSYYHDEDVEYNVEAIRDLTLTAPLLLGSTVYP